MRSAAVLFSLLLALSGDPADDRRAQHIFMVEEDVFELALPMSDDPIPDGTHWMVTGRVRDNEPEFWFRLDIPYEGPAVLRFKELANKPVVGQLRDLMNAGVGELPPNEFAKRLKMRSVQLSAKECDALEPLSRGFLALPLGTSVAGDLEIHPARYELVVESRASKVTIRRGGVPVDELVQWVRELRSVAHRCGG